MELKSTSTFKDIDIDAMLEHTSFDEFMQGLYMNRAKSNTKGEAGMTDFDRMMANVMDGGEDEQTALKLEFEGEDEIQVSEMDRSMEAQALKNVRERRKRLQ